MVNFENIAKQVTQKGPYKGHEYFTFTLNIPVTGGFVRGTGWQYYPSTGSLGAPQKNHGTTDKPNYHATQWIGGDAFYKAVRQEAQDYFVARGYCREPWETPEERKADRKAASDEMSEEEYKRLEIIACQHGAKTQEQVDEFINRRKKKGKKR